MRTLKNGVLIIVLSLILAFTATMVLPMDDFVAKQASGIKGYDLITDYEDSDYRYYYNHLNENEQLAYSLICAEILDFPEEILVPSLGDTELQNVFKALSYDNPELFFLGNKCSFTSIGSFNYFIPQYIMNADQYSERLSRIDDVVNVIISGIPEGATDFEKELYIHDYVTSHCEYSDVGTQMIYTIYGALIDGKANCEGYSRTMQYILEKVGIKNYLATGTAINASGENEGHMWNIVEIEGEYFNLDATWDDYTVVNSALCPDNSPSHSYFNITTEKISSTHVVDDEALWVDCVSEENDYFEYMGLRFEECNSKTESVIRQSVADSLMLGKYSLEIAFTNEQAYGTAVQYFVEDNRLYTILRAVNEVVPTTARVNAKQIQYSNDDDKLILRFFFLK